MTNLENIAQFLFESDIDTINEFIGEPVAIEVNKSEKDVDEKTKEFIYRLAQAIRNNKPNCIRNCFFRKNK